MALRGLLRSGAGSRGFEKRKTTSLYPDLNRMAMDFGRDRPWGSAVFAMAAASFLVLASSVARADPGDSDGDLVPDDIEDRTERNVAWNVWPDVTPKSLSLTSKSIGAPSDDQFEFEFNEGTFHVEYFPREFGAPASSLSVAFTRLFEWVDDDGDEVVDGGEVRKEWSLGGSVFENATMSYQVTSDADGGVVYEFETHTSWREGTDVTLVLTASQRFLRVAPDRILTPMEVKADLYLNHTFLNLGSRVGVALRVEADDESEMMFERASWDSQRGFSTDDSWIQVTAGSPRSTTFFSWENNATADDVEGPLATSMDTWMEPSERVYELLFAYPAGPLRDSVRIVHDPTLGVVSAAYEGILLLPPPPDLQGDAVLYGVSLVGMAVLVGTTVLLAGRRRRKRE